VAFRRLVWPTASADSVVVVTYSTFINR